MLHKKKKNDGFNLICIKFSIHTCGYLKLVFHFLKENTIEKYWKGRSPRIKSILYEFCDSIFY